MYAIQVRDQLNRKRFVVGIKPSKKGTFIVATSPKLDQAQSFSELSLAQTSRDVCIDPHNNFSKVTIVRGFTKASVDKTAEKIIKSLDS